MCEQVSCLQMAFANGSSILFEMVFKLTPLQFSLLFEFCYASHTALFHFQTFAYAWFKLGMGSGIISNRGKIVFQGQWLT